MLRFALLLLFVLATPLVTEAARVHFRLDYPQTADGQVDETLLGATDTAANHGDPLSTRGSLPWKRNGLDLPFFRWG